MPGSSLYASALAGWRTGLLATFSWIALGIESIIHPQQNNIRDLYWMIPFTLTALTFVYLHRLQRSATFLTEQIAFYALMGSMALVWLGNVGLLTDQPLLTIFSFPYGPLLWISALIGYGVVTLKINRLPRYVGWTLILLEPVSLLCGLALSPVAPLLDRGAYSAGVEKGMAVFLVAWGIRSLTRRIN
ncbi:hypothetical protein GCM10023189_51500 [Nibrella saemangeumensis]|uniref:Uncharacterized protein n=2 Tax=Nibrella saemangeumensis TaxID=1084526 RepID=A0ABP8NIG3_9BACT